MSKLLQILKMRKRNYVVQLKTTFSPENRSLEDMLAFAFIRLFSTIRFFTPSVATLTTYEIKNVILQLNNFKAAQFDALLQNTIKLLADSFG